MERRKLRTLRGLINLSLLALIFGAILQLMIGLLDSYTALLLGLAVVALTFYCYRRADREDAGSLSYSLWRLLPTLAFIAVPLAVYWYGSDNQWSSGEVLLLVQIACSYILPILCLLFVERVLKKAQQ